MRVYVARHGETTWNVAGRYQGRLESDLSPLGIRQAEALAGAFDGSIPRIGRIVTSPLLRCRQTANSVAQRLEVALETDDRLVEIGHGTWEGRLRAEVALADPDRFERWRTHPASVVFEGGESLADVQARWTAFASEFEPSTPALIVTHDAVVRVALLWAQGQSLDALWTAAVENAGFAEFEVNRGRWTLVRENVNAHLSGLRANTGTQAL